MKSKKRKFIEIAPEMAEGKWVQWNIPREVIALIVDLAQNPEAATYPDLMEFAGRDVVAPAVIKLASMLAQLCDGLADGRSKKAIHAYLNCRISIAAFYTGCSGRDLLDVVTGMVRRDLIGRPNPWVLRR